MNLDPIVFVTGLILGLVFGLLLGAALIEAVQRDDKRRDAENAVTLVPELPTHR